MAGPHEVHTDGNAVPPLDAEFEAALDAIRGIHPALDLIADGYRLLALDRLSIENTQTVLVTLAGSATARTSSPSKPSPQPASPTPTPTPPCAASTWPHRRTSRAAEPTSPLRCPDPDLHQHASNASGAIHTD
jgi:hypothetical protein